MSFAMGVTTYGGPEALHELDVPIEPLGPTDVRLRVLAAAVNPTDTLVRSGARAQGSAAAPPGDVPGMDVAGVVEGIGEDAGTRLHVGERVMAIVVPSGPHGAYRHNLVLPAASVVPVPEGSSDAEAATLPMNGLTARMALDAMALEPGRTIAVTGAAGAFGGYVVQLAKAAGLIVVADAAESDEELVRALGADVVVRRGDDVAGRIREQVPDGVDAVADGAVQCAAVLPAVRDGGILVSVRGWTDDTQDRVRTVPVLVREYAQETAKLDALRGLAQSGALTGRVADVLPATEAAKAHERLEAGGVRGRLVLDFT